MSHISAQSQYRGAEALSEESLRRYVPSIFAVEKHDSRSERFQPIPTIEIVRALGREGFSVVSAAQSRTRDVSKRDFTKHLLRLRRLDAEPSKVGNALPEVVIRNANDGTAAYKLMAGLFRTVCMNGLISYSELHGETTVRHTGSSESIQGKVIEGTYRVLEQSQKALGAAEAWSGIELNQEERMVLAHAAREIRWPTEKGADVSEVFGARIGIERLLKPVRREDRGADLWRTFNVLQERIIKGGQRHLRDVVTDGVTVLRHVKTREVKGIDQLVGINKALWMVTNHFAEQRGVKLAA